MIVHISWYRTALWADYVYSLLSYKYKVCDDLADLNTRSVVHVYRYKHNLDKKLHDVTRTIGLVQSSKTLTGQIL